MNNIKNSYCLLKYACSFGFSRYPQLRKSREKCRFQDYEIEFFVEEFNNFKEIKERINYIYDEIVQGCKVHNIDIYSDQCSFPEFFICNGYGNSLSAGVSVYGWRILHFFRSYLRKYLEQKYGKSEVKDNYLQLVAGNEVYFYWDYKSEPIIDSSEALVSEETAHIILKEFLDTGKTKFDTDFSAVYEREIAKINY